MDHSNPSFGSARIAAVGLTSRKGASSSNHTVKPELDCSADSACRGMCQVSSRHGSFKVLLACILKKYPACSTSVCGPSGQGAVGGVFQNAQERTDEEFWDNEAAQAITLMELLSIRLFQNNKD